WDGDVGLYDFGARHYDAFTGRFLTPDSGLGSDDLFRADAMNRFAFELNNPINHVDPTGNLSIAAIFGLVIGLALIVAGGVVLGGAATLAATVAGCALIGAGVGGMGYSNLHADDSGWSFWK